MIARTMPLALISEIGRSWPLFVLAVGSVVVASVVLGWLMARWRLLPGTTAVWGSFPGAATAMVLMAEAFGADARLVDQTERQRARIGEAVDREEQVERRLWLEEGHPAGRAQPLAQDVARQAAALDLVGQKRLALGQSRDRGHADAQRAARPARFDESGRP